MGVRAPAAYGRGMSYSEKYRGTEWGQPVEPGPTAPQPSQSGGGGGGRFMVVILGLVVVAGLVGVGAFILSQPAAPTRPVYGARNTAAPTPDRGPLVASFVELTKRPDLTYHWHLDSSIQAGFSAMDITADMDVAGKDQAGTITFAQGKQKIVAEMVVKKGVVYTREAGGRWRKGDIPADEAPVDPLTSVAAGATFLYAGSERREGSRVVHQLRSKNWVLNDVQKIAASQGMSVKVASTRFDVFVSEKGVPEEGRFTARMSMVVDGQKINVTVSGSYTFSRFGEPITIKAPKV
jgi:hypothetical protein